MGHQAASITRLHVHTHPKRVIGRGHDTVGQPIYGWSHYIAALLPKHGALCTGSMCCTGWTFKTVAQRCDRRR